MAECPLNVYQLVLFCFVAQFVLEENILRKMARFCGQMFFLPVTQQQ